ncbi:SDR family NAD(P)-dependent oxidoreductase [Bradyrhizobium sp. SZCCHNRI2049]|uniref:SDR family NAD(P)-dependent oxidoreductase n=1 Tax=Bradyrhizobium sp. SZCCHNRI2049 TaxID=3057287 RepID=UPI00291665F9|nr:SDR family NAD(P)-dependent oxidoreductase [Bradyrhizobium sp. SZCCHNRI2049]
MNSQIADAILILSGRDEVFLNDLLRAMSKRDRTKGAIKAGNVFIAGQFWPNDRSIQLEGCRAIILRSDWKEPLLVISELRSYGVRRQEALAVVGSFLKHAVIDQGQTRDVGALPWNCAVAADWCDRLGEIDVIVRPAMNPAGGAGARKVGCTLEPIFVELSSRGLFLQPGWTEMEQDLTKLAGRLKKRDYCVRLASIHDLPALIELERLCWPDPLQLSSEILLERLTQYPAGQLLLIYHDSVVGAIYSQRITSSHFEGVNARSVHQLHDPSGSIVQLLGLNILPQFQNSGLGDELLDFALEYCAVVSGISTVIGITRCIDYDRVKNEISLADYILKTDRNGRLVDPVLRMHQLHGAEVVRLIPAYRPGDCSNDGYGVLVRYDLLKRVQKTSRDEGSNSNAAIGDAESFLNNALSTMLAVQSIDEADKDRPLFELGISSADLFDLRGRIRRELGIELNSVFFFEQNTYRKMVERLTVLVGSSKTYLGYPAQRSDNPRLPVSSIAHDTPSGNDFDVAIIGIACRLPGGVRDLEGLWKLVAEAECVIGQVPEGRWVWPATVEPFGSHSGIGAGGFLEESSPFDSSFFQIVPKQGSCIDPQQGLVLELSWECLENAGYTRTRLSGSDTGVFVGASNSGHDLYLAERAVDAQFSLATSMALLANRISYFYHWHGPSIQIDTACSSSLVAVHEAVRALRSRDCELALVAGVNVMCHPAATVSFYEAGMLSREGRCRPFDKRANGYVRGEGGVVVLLKSLSKAITDNDNIHAVIKGSATNHGGRAAGLTVPNPSLQAELIKRAHRDARVPASSIGYVEAHGTGTPLGDPVEVAGLKRAFGYAAEKDKTYQTSCALGSIKGNIGHLEAAAGLAGLVKTVLCVQQARLPPLAGFDELNPEISLVNSPFYVPTVSDVWALEPGIPARRAGVSSFGFGGANAHVVVEEYFDGGQKPARAGSSALRGQCQLFLLSARDPIALRIRHRQLLDWLAREDAEDVDLENVAFTLQIGREPMECRSAIVAHSLDELRAQLGDYLTSTQACSDATIKRQLRIEEKASSDLIHLTQLCENWLAGENVEWSGFWKGSAASLLRLPSYPFSERRSFETKSGRANRILQREADRAGDVTITGMRPTAAERKKITLLELGSSAGTTPGHMRSEPPSEDSSRGRLHAEEESGGAFPVALERVIRESLAEALMLDPGALSLDRQFVDVGLDSVSAVEWVRSINRRFGTTMPATVIYKCPNLHLLCKHISQLISSKATGVQSRAVAPSSPEKLRRLSSTEDYRLESPSAIEVIDGSGSARSADSSKSLSAPKRESEVRPTDASSHVRVRPICAASTGNQSGAAIAIIGMSGRYPEAENLAQYWNNLVNERMSITEIAKERWDVEKWYDPAKFTKNKTYSKWLGALDNIDKFDCEFFGIPPGEAEVMDPQHRLFLEQAYLALEQAGYGGARAPGKRCGIYLGISNNEYAHLLRASAAKVADRIGNSVAMASARLAYALDLAGPAVSIDTACSSSLVATHLGYTALLNHEIDLAVVGGISLYLTPELYIEMSASGVLAPDGRCKPFDNAADGFVPGEAAGAVVLKRLEDAEQDRDLVLAIIVASGLNQDGRTNGITAPSMARQSELIRSVYAQSSIEPSSISYIEAHGTGTKLGDPIELDALAAVLGEEPRTAPCLVGSVKGNIGHASAAAGIASLHKVVLSMQNSLLPRTVGFRTPNEHFDFKNAPLRINAQLRRWDSLNEPIRAGISSFGMSGTNAHIVVQKYSPNDTVKRTGRPRKVALIFILSAQTKQALVTYAERMLMYLSENRSLLLEDVVFTVQTRRTMPWRLAVVTDGLDGLVQELAAFRDGVERAGVHHGKADSTPMTSIFDDQDVDVLQSWVAKSQLNKVARLWVSGARVDWPRVQPLDVARIVSLPGYPFAKEKFWMPSSAATGGSSSGQAPTSPVEPRKSYAAASDGVIALGEDVALRGEAGSRVQEVKDVIDGLVRQFVHKGDTAAIDFEQDAGGLGIDSVAIVRICAEVNARYGLQLGPVAFFDHPTLERLSTFIARQLDTSLDRDSNTHEHDSCKLAQASHGGSEPIAVIGIGARFPFADDHDEYWDNLVAGRDCISEVPSERWNWSQIAEHAGLGDGALNLRWGGFIEGVDEFDPLLFCVSPRDAERMDAQQRLMLTYVWKALEDAGYSPETLAKSSTGVFFATGGSAYGRSGPSSLSELDGASSLGKVLSLGPNRVSHFFDWNGPSEPVETACSSSLVAVHRAANALLLGECDLAIAGAVNTLVTPDPFVALARAGMLSPTGRCKAFSSSADGYVRAEGIGVLVLKRLSSAERDEDHIYGLLRASAVNHGGRARSLTAPNPMAQAAVIERAYQAAGIDSSTVTYVEAHGTGTKLGDPIEFDALVRAFARSGGSEVPSHNYCGLGSVKTNVGHLEIAAGMAGIIKVLLQLRNKTLVKTLHATDINPLIDLTGTPFYLVRENRPWPQLSRGAGEILPRRAGVSAFGFGGVNAHVVLEEYLDQGAPPAYEEGQSALIVLSARNRERLRATAARLLRAMASETWDERDLINIAYTLQIGRREFEHRLAFACNSIAELRQILNAFLTCEGHSRWSIFETAKQETLDGAAISPSYIMGAVERLEILRKWTQGARVDWVRLYTRRPRRISLPGCELASRNIPTFPTRNALSKHDNGRSKTSADGSNAAGKTIMLVPRWTVALPEWRSSNETIEEVLVFGGSVSDQEAVRRIYSNARTFAIDPDDTVEECVRVLATIGKINRIVWLAPGDSSSSLRGQQIDVPLAFFRLVKALIELQYDRAGLGWTIVTRQALSLGDNEEADPMQAALHGFVGSLAKELPDWSICLVDLGENDKLTVDLFSLPSDRRGRAWLKRERIWYRQKLVRCQLGPRSRVPVYKKGGIYVVVGGAGNVSQAWSEHLINNYGAKIIWLGRRKLDSEISSKVARLARLGPSPEYLSVDATNLEALRAAYQSIKERHGQINGVVHAAMVFSNTKLAEMDEARFQETMASKRDSSVHLAQILKDEPLDLILFFSSMITFSKNARQSHYSSACCFEDAFASQMQRVCPFDVKTINWGYWHTSTVSQSEDYQQLSKIGIGLIDMQEGMLALDLLISSPLKQLAVLRLTGDVPIEGVDQDEVVCIAPSSQAPVQPEHESLS